MYRKIFGLISICVAALQGQALAQNADIKIQSVFKQIQDENYTPDSVKQALADLDAIGTRDALTASIIMSHYELATHDTTNARLSLLGERAKTFLDTYEPASESDIDQFVELYDGTSSSLVKAFYGLIGAEKNKNIAWKNRVERYDKAPRFGVPCNFFFRHPDVGRFTIYHGKFGHRYAIPLLEIDCETNKTFKDENENIFSFWLYGGTITDYVSSSCGTIHRDHAATKRQAKTAIFYRPYDYKKFIEGWKGAPDLGNLRKTALYDWALVGRSNYNSFLELDALYQPAREDLEAYYQKYFSFSAADAQYMSAYALLSQLHGASRQTSFSRAMNKSLEGQRKIRSDILSGESVTPEDLALFKNLNFESEKENKRFFDISLAGEPEPLLHLAIGRDDLFQEMIEIGFDIEARDALGKTTLMAAVQENNFEATKKLMAAGAAVNAVSLNPKDIVGNSGCSSPYKVGTGERSPLNYALSESSEDIVKLLLEAGAKINHVDSAGNTILDYFDGKGPTEKNLKLSDGLRDLLIDESETSNP